MSLMRYWLRTRSLLNMGLVFPWFDWVCCSTAFLALRVVATPVFGAVSASVCNLSSRLLVVPRVCGCYVVFDGSLLDGSSSIFRRPQEEEARHFSLLQRYLLSLGCQQLEEGGRRMMSCRKQFFGTAFRVNRPGPTHHRSSLRFPTTSKAQQGFREPEPANYRFLAACLHGPAQGLAVPHRH